MKPYSLKTKLELLFKILDHIEFEEDQLVLKNISIKNNNDVVIKSDKNVIINSNKTNIDPKTNNPFSIYLNSPIGE